MTPIQTFQLSYIDTTTQQEVFSVSFTNLTTLTPITNGSQFGYVLDLPNTYLNASNIPKSVSTVVSTPSLVKGRGYSLRIDSIKQAFDAHLFVYRLREGLK